MTKPGKGSDVPAETAPSTAVDTTVWQSALMLTDDQLADITTWEDLGAVIGSDVDVIDASDYGTGFAVLPDRDKSLLVGVEFAIVGWKFYPGTYGDFVSLHVLTRDGRKIIVNDGGSGICAQMALINRKAQGKRAVVRVPKGLTRSDYTYVDDKGKETPASTFYLSLEK